MNKVEICSLLRTKLKKEFVKKFVTDFLMVGVMLLTGMFMRGDDLTNVEERFM